MSKAWQGWTVAEKRQWRKYTRPAVLARDGGLCQLRYEGSWFVKVKGPDNAVVWEERRCLGTADQVHHTKGNHTKNDVRYLVAACGPCNRHAGNPTKRRVLGSDAKWC